MKVKEVDGVLFVSDYRLTRWMKVKSALGWFFNKLVFWSFVSVAFFGGMAEAYLAVYH